MKRKAVLTLAIMMALAHPAAAATSQIAEGMANKAIRGAVNLCTGVVEIPMQIYKGYSNGFPLIENKAGSKVVGTILGFFRGFGHAAGRVSWGGMELFGFWTANPPDNEGFGVPFDATYPWEMGEQYSFFKPSLSEGIKPVGRKLLRGASDSFLGILELPAMITQGEDQGNLLHRAGKGVWFWWSREVYGFTGIFTCLVPNPGDNPGYPMNSQYVWDAFDKSEATTV